MLNKNLLSTTTVILSLVGLWFGVSVSYANAARAARIAAGHAILHTNPAPTYKTIAIIPAGAKVQVNGCLPDKTWCSFQYNGIVGWASARYLNTNDVPTISFTSTRVKSDSMMKTREKNSIKHVIPSPKAIMKPQKIGQWVQSRYITDVPVNHTGIKRDERTILDPSTQVQNISVEHVAAYNPLFPDDVNYKNFERNETRYRVVTYPVPYR
ncbi:SH3 domain-containing protein [Bartonella sp. B17]